MVNVSIAEKIKNNKLSFANYTEYTQELYLKGLKGILVISIITSVIITTVQKIFNNSLVSKNADVPETTLLVPTAIALFIILITLSVINIDYLSKKIENKTYNLKDNVRGKIKSIVATMLTILFVGITAGVIGVPAMMLLYQINSQLAMITSDIIIYVSTIYLSLTSYIVVIEKKGALESLLTSIHRVNRNFLRIVAVFIGLAMINGILTLLFKIVAITSMTVIYYSLVFTVTQITQVAIMILYYETKDTKPKERKIKNAITKNTGIESIVTKKESVLDDIDGDGE